ncbi:integrase core domain protein [Ancylostoma duodenale]|uniref:Integrase core domain protein n=1 Tax=Ancylostoma duodenale TaxID=51022 RepID=A0A0C2C525_9BILA|nr:integrase core domain protein [Ancylostoma duodenale]
MAKSRLNPMKEMTMPRLELLATLISVRLARFMQTQIDLKISAVHIFSDSQIVLHWLHSNKSLPLFVSNKVKLIRAILDRLAKDKITPKLHYVQSSDNPADYATRGISPDDANSHKWWHGPKFLSLNPNDWPFAKLDFTVAPEASSGVQANASVIRDGPSHISLLPFVRINQYWKLVRCVVYIFKFLKIRILLRLKSFPLKERLSSALPLVKVCTPTSDVSVPEFSAAELFLLKEHYRESTNDLRELPLHKFNAKYTADGIIKCPTPLRNADVTKQAKSPTMLVPKHALTKMIIFHYHKRLLHSGVQSTIAALKESYFIPRIKSVVTKVLRKCIICKRFNALAYRYPDMPSLPESRVTRCRPFQKIGLDYLGPLHYRDNTGAICKCWICLITCMATRGIHLEVVMNCTTIEFLMALRRFIARRGVPDLMLSDNSTTFTSASEHLAEFCTKKPVTDFSVNQKIVWKFITPLSPWKGGFYERLVGLFKNAFHKTVGRSILPFNQFLTLIVEIESIMNCRPLTATHSTDSELRTIRPIDFISPDVDLDLTDSVDNMNDLYALNNLSLQKQRLLEWHNQTVSTLNYFWKLWHSDYLAALADRRTNRIRQKRSTPLQPKNNDVVIVADEAIPRGQWPLGILTSTHQDADGYVRSATIRTPRGKEVKRSINHLYPLELNSVENYSKENAKNIVVEERIQPARACKTKSSSNP